MAKLISITQTTKPTALAISLEDAKQFLKIDHNYDNKLIEAIITSVTQKCELYTGLALTPPENFTREINGARILM